MDRVFGIPAGPLAAALAILLVVALGVLTAMALKNVVFLKIGVRNIPRRRSRSALIVAGLMLGTAIISASLLTGDTMATAVRGSVTRSMGVTDELVTAGTTANLDTGDSSLTAAKPYFPQSAAVAAVDAAAKTLPVDAVAAAIIEPVAGQNPGTGSTDPKVTLFAPDPARAGKLAMAQVATLEPGEAFINDYAARELRARSGDSIRILVGDRAATVTVAGVVGYHGVGTDKSAVIVPLAAAQTFLDRPGQVNYVLVSNTGGETSGAALTSRVEPALDRAVAPMGLDAQPAKRDGLKAADAAGDAFVQLFTTFGSFSMAAGILLIFLIFVMLAAERRPEMGMARAIGTQRRHIVQSFVYEGAAYDLMAAAIGALLGIGVSYVMVKGVSNTFRSQGLSLGYSMTGRSLLIAYALGVLLTLIVVAASASRVSRLNIVSAIRDIPESDVATRHRRWWRLPALGLVLGAVMAVSGVASHVYLPWMVGVSIVVLAAVPLLKRWGVNERLVYTVAGVFLIAFWLLPLSTFDHVFGHEMSKDFSVWVACGLIIVVAATWLITYNADVLLGIAWRLASPFRSLRPIARMAVAYPLKSRFRSGVTMAMFMLVVFTLVTGSTIPSAFVRAFDNVHRFGGGYDIRVTTAPGGAVPDLRSVLPPTVAQDIVADGAQSFLPVQAVQAGTTRKPVAYALRGLDDAYLQRTTYDFSAMATGYATPRQVWDALRTQPGLAVVDPFVAPRRNNWSVGVMPDFRLSGFYIEDGSFTPVSVDIQDPVTGSTNHVTVIGVLGDDTPQAMAGITVSQRFLAPFGDRALPTVHHLAVRPGADPQSVADRVEAALLSRGAEAQTYQHILDEAVGASMTFIRIIQGLMALGLVVGVAALGVVTARAVVERRQQIGMLRAIGFQPAMIRRGLLAETGVVAGTAIAVGAVLAFLISYNVIADIRTQPGYVGVTFAVPWLNLAAIIAAVIVAAVGTTLGAAARATRLYPAEALRYQ
jgi:putative ABC transport system permease protein